MSLSYFLGGLLHNSSKNGKSLFLPKADPGLGFDCKIIWELIPGSISLRGSKVE